MVMSIGAMGSAIGSFFTDGLKFFAYDKIFDFVGERVKGETADKVGKAILEQGRQWWGLSRSEEQLLAALYVALFRHYSDEYDELRKALDVVWKELLALDKGRGKWSKRWRMTFTGIALTEGIPIPDGTRHVKSKTPILTKDRRPVLGPNNEPLYIEEYENGTKLLELSKDDPRVLHLYVIAKMARDEFNGVTLPSGTKVLGNEKIPNTIEHLMVTYLQDDPFFKLLGKKWRAIVTWMEGRHPLRQAEAWLWLTADERSRINALDPATGKPLFTEAEKTEARKLLSQGARELFRSDLRDAKKEPRYKAFIRLWWLFAIPAALIIIAWSL